MLLPLFGASLADVIVKVVADVIATFVLIWQMLCQLLLYHWYIVAEGIVVPVADVIATIDFDLADVIAKADVVARWLISKSKRQYL